MKPHWSTSVLAFAYLPGRKQESKIAFAEGIFDVFITLGLRDAELLKVRRHRTAVITLSAKSNRLEDLRPFARKIVAAVEAIRPGEVVHISAAAKMPCFDN